MFKTNNPDLMKVAMMGDQILMKPKSWTDGYTPVTPDNTAFEDYVNKKVTVDMTETPKKSDGGFWNRPFGNTKGCWCVKGAGL
jgi:hypothetical protein